MGTPFLGEIKIIAWNFAPKGWTFCNGQQLPINQNQALFAILGTTYGGNGQTTFALPDLRGRTPVHVGDGITLGEAAGTQSVTLTISTLAGHSHSPNAQSAAGIYNTPDPGAGSARLLAKSTGVTGSPGSAFGANIYSAAAGTLNPMAPQIIGNVGGNQPHQNMSPYLTLNFIIALQGVFPSQN